MIRRRPNRQIVEAENYNGTTSSTDFGTISSAFNSDTPHTILSLIRPTGTGEGGFAYVCGKVPSGLAAGMRLFLSHGAGTPTPVFALDSSGSVGNPTITGTAGAVVYNIWQHIAVTWDGGLAAAGMAMYIGLNGARLAPASVTPTDGIGVVADNATRSLFIGNRHGSDRTFNGDIAYFAMWPRILSQAQLLRAQQDGPGSVPGAIMIWAGGRDWSQMGRIPANATIDVARVPGPRFPSTLGVGRFQTAPVGFVVSAAAFNVAWAGAANTVIHPGAIQA